MEALSPVELLARVAEALDPRTWIPQGRAGGADPPLVDEPAGLVREVSGVELVDAAAARVEYVRRWVEADGRSIGPEEVHSLTVRRTPRGWRVRDADLTGLGGGRIWLPDEVFAHLHAAFAGEL